MAHLAVLIFPLIVLIIALSGTIQTYLPQDSILDVILKRFCISKPAGFCDHVEGEILLGQRVMAPFGQTKIHSSQSWHLS
jgi:hypothetical protein